MLKDEVLLRLPPVSYSWLLLLVVLAGRCGHGLRRCRVLRRG
jgi:hypothetical protein